MKLTQEQLNDLYRKEFHSDMTFNEVESKLETYSHKQINELRSIFCDDLLSGVSEGILEYPKNFKYPEDSLFAMLVRQMKKLSNEFVYAKALYEFFMGNHAKCLSLIKKDLKLAYENAKKNNQLSEFYYNESALVQNYIVPYKQAFDGFWNELANIIKQYPSDKNIDKLCILMGDFYSCENAEQKIDLLQTFILNYPEFSTPKELLGVTYQELKMWRNAIACFEGVEDNSVYFFKEDILWLVAWAYGKCRDYKNEELYYRKIVELNVDMPFLYNNLGYCLMRQKRYIEAKEILEHCILSKKDMPFSANNYLSLLISLGRNKDAKAFVKNSEFNLNKKLVEKVKHLKPTNARLKKPIEVTFDSEKEEEVVGFSKNIWDEKEGQFSNEKLLEDELTARIESGRPVFGKQLKVYKRKGVYGRQYIIPIGRLDLLCEDNEGNLYVIELKKDSGYDDVYEQITSYLKWFEENMISSNQKVYGIICLNQPTKELVDKVRLDGRIQIFEYQISYREIK